ncbi:MAG: hypothetical protein MH321_08110 [Leptospiraceae bacterium]|nr:hypothetical protein [Leptospiraceae bacterium]
MKQSLSLDEIEVYTNNTLDYSISWHWLVKTLESNPNLWEEKKEQIAKIAEMLPYEFRRAPFDSYRIDKELGFDQREGPEYEFESFLDEPMPLWKISGIANFDLSKKKNLWKEFSLKYSIPYWQLTRWMYSNTKPLEYLPEPFLKKIQGLSLCHIDPKDLELLKIFQNKDNWNHWDFLEWHWIRDDSSKHIIAWMESLENGKLKKFSLNYSQIGTKGYSKLGQLISFWKDLESLTLHNVYLGEDELYCLLNQNPEVKNLKSISLDDSSFSNGGKEELHPEHFVAMAESGWFNKLERLHLRYHKLGTDGISALGESHAFESLQFLRIEVGRMDDEQLLLLSEIPWKKLAYISLSYNSKVTEHGLTNFKNTKLFENCTYVYIEHSNGKSLSKGSLFK